MSKTDIFQTIQFSVSTLLSSIWPLDKSLQALPLRARVDLRAMAINDIFRIPQSSSITGVLPSDCLVS